MSGYLDDREFKRAMGEYLQLTSKGAAQAINHVTKDWLYRSSKVVKKASRENIARVIKEPRFISWYLNQKHGKGNWDAPGDEVDGNSDWALAVKALRRRLSSIGYVSSGLVNAGDKFPQDFSSHPGKEQKPKRRRKFKQVKIKTRMAFPHSLRTNFVIDSGASSGSDAAEKQRLQYNGLVHGRRAKIKDMQKYIDKKNRENSKKVSIK